eukprot:TRINITY_DN21698_c0_g1_i6.p2 TRINITY_DN21698_c0_g1~~TRINITY_DN21698_c0_g1_i6.p2  ORF type:complete len:181 (-),score=44.21 TRINITY_DN21698_c0_g1_i6:166-708(-)
MEVAAFVGDVWNSDEKSFTLINYSALLPWLLMFAYLLFPVLRPARHFVKTYILGVCLVYLLKLLPILSAGLEGFEYRHMVEAFKKSDVVVICWAHFIAFDLHAAYSLVEVIHSRGWGFIWRLSLFPTLPLVLMFGPVRFLLAHILMGVFGLFASAQAQHQDDAWAAKGPGLPTSSKRKVH